MSSNVFQSEFPQPISFKNPPEKENGDLGGWSSFILTLETCPETTTVEAEYIHRQPIAASWNQCYSSSSSSSLSIKSLEICTEGLGSESGSNIDELIDDLSNNNNNNNNSKVEKQTPLFQRSKKTNRNVSLFPPPLTSISGFETTRVRPYRESGRLVIKATSFSNSSFQAERADGRLRLYSSIVIDDDIDDEEKEDEEENEMTMKMMTTEKEKLVEMEMEEFLRTTKSCKETGPGKTGMPIIWGPHWVAIS